MAVVNQSEPSPHSNVAAMVRVLLTWRNVDAKDLAKGIGLSQQTLSDRLTGKRDFRSNEIERIAAFFGVTPGVFYLSLDQLLKATITRLKSATVGKDAGQRLAPVKTYPRPKLTPDRALVRGVATSVP